MELEALGKARRRAEMKAKVSMRTQSVKRVLSGDMASLTKANLKQPSSLHLQESRLLHLLDRAMLPDAELDERLNVG